MAALVQSFPEHGLLANNLDLSISQLRRRISKQGIEQAAFSYVLKSVKFDRTRRRFEQHGSAPNFQGGRLTLCTCKHQMRASLDMSRWQEKWIAGFTSRTLHEGQHWLFFLTRIADAYESHFDLWRELSAIARRSKSAETNFLGDVFEPLDDLAGESRFNPSNYRAPSHHAHHKHKCDNGWRNDIRYKHTIRYGRSPALLVGDPNLMFIWEAPKIFIDEKHCRNFRKWDRMAELVELLK